MARKPTQHFRDDELIDAFELRSPGKLTEQSTFIFKHFSFLYYTRQSKNTPKY